MSEERITRREIIKRAAYMTPAILTLLAAPSFASGGSGRYEGNERDERDEIYGGNDRRKKRQSNWDYQEDRRSGKGRRWF